MDEPITVLIVDDSRLFRSALEDALAGQGDITVVGSVFSGAKALEFIRNAPPSIVTLDVDMPGMDGLATLEQIQRFNAERPAGEAVGVIMVSAFTRRGADVTVKALQTGAFDFVTKPSGPAQDVNVATLRDELVAKIRACVRRVRKPAPAAGKGARRPPLLPPLVVQTTCPRRSARSSWVLPRAGRVPCRPFCRICAA
jgi:two-component system, chemotaxis family, protein-glutamate methylesterase/glutaminase